VASYHLASTTAQHPGSRKEPGGDIVLEAAQALRQRGLEIELDLVGPPTLPVQTPPYARFHGSLSRKAAGEDALLRRLFLTSTFLFVPSRAEAHGRVFCEAAGFALPTVTTGVGGIPEIVLDGLTGAVLPLEAGPDAYAAAIACLVADPVRYTDMARRARQEYEARLNWDAFGDQIRALLVRIMEGRDQRP
jgi:glycosyltransferase involved in cell wall biosynthesis